MVWLSVSGSCPIAKSATQLDGPSSADVLFTCARGAPVVSEPYVTCDPKFTPATADSSKSKLTLLVRLPPVVVAVAPTRSANELPVASIFNVEVVQESPEYVFAMSTP